MKTLFKLLLMTPLILSADFCGEKLKLGDKIPFGWENFNGQIIKRTKDAECKILPKDNKIARMSKTINKKYLIKPNINKINHLKIIYDENHIITTIEEEDISLFKNMMNTTEGKILEIDAIRKQENMYIRHLSKCSSPSANCTNTLEKGFLNDKN